LRHRGELDRFTARFPPDGAPNPRRYRVRVGPGWKTVGPWNRDHYTGGTWQRLDEELVALLAARLDREWLRLPPLQRRGVNRSASGNLMRQCTPNRSPMSRLFGETLGRLVPCAPHTTPFERAYPLYPATRHRSPTVAPARSGRDIHHRFNRLSSLFIHRSAVSVRLSLFYLDLHELR